MAHHRGTGVRPWRASALSLWATVTLLILLAGLTQILGRLPGHAAPAPGPVPAFMTSWHAGNFRYLQEEGPGASHELAAFVAGLDHPSAGGYGKVSSTRTNNFNAFLDALFTAINDSLNNGDTGDWCGVKTRAAAAGYEVRRFYDTTDGRWFVYGRDTTSYGQAYFFINPHAKNNIVVEVPHEPDDSGTAVEGARIFKALAARALIINKERRCSDPDPSPCDGTTSACSTDGSLAPYRESDLAHHWASTFHLLHVRYNGISPAPKFVQLHGYESTSGSKAVVGDGTKNDLDANSVSVSFVNNLRKYGPAADVVSCQEAAGDPTPAYCGETNAQGRYTNAPAGDLCYASTTSHSGRFLHVEQAATMRDDNKEASGWYWGDVSQALWDTWADCSLNGGSTDCTLGPQQTRYGSLTCP